MIATLTLFAELWSLLVELTALALLPEFSLFAQRLSNSPGPMARMTLSSAAALLPARLLYLLYNHKPLWSRQR